MKNGPQKITRAGPVPLICSAWAFPIVAFGVRDRPGANGSGKASQELTQLSIDGANGPAECDVQ